LPTRKVNNPPSKVQIQLHNSLQTKCKALQSTLHQSASNEETMSAVSPFYMHTSVSSIYIICAVLCTPCFLPLPARFPVYLCGRSDLLSFGSYINLYRHSITSNKTAVSSIPNSQSLAINKIYQSSLLSDNCIVSPTRIANSTQRNPFTTFLFPR